MKRGIDISAWQGNVNFDKVKQSGIEFVIIRAGFGQGSIDRKFKTYISECNRLGIPCGVYWFSYAYSVDMAIKEAQFALKAVSGYKLDYPIFWDFEYDSINLATKKGVYITKQLASDMAKAFMNTISAAGYHTGNYTNLDFSRRYFSKDVLENYDLWAARYVKSPVDIVNGAELWQYSSKGKVTGINGNVDMDYAIKDYVAINPSANIPAVNVEIAKESYGIPSMYQWVFDPDYYVAKYEDLADAVSKQITLGYIKNTAKDKAWWLYQHFLKYGMEEGRQGCENFDVMRYKDAYKDLRDVFGDDFKPYYYHYIQYGQKEIENGQRRAFI
jgi:GH25 family lysozyme M1 (1,4-beta-N-acetylmuramidase)